jgi:hypothetical protein
MLRVARRTPRNSVRIGADHLGRPLISKAEGRIAVFAVGTGEEPTITGTRCIACGAS